MPVGANILHRWVVVRWTQHRLSDCERHALGACRNHQFPRFAPRSRSAQLNARNYRKAIPSEIIDRTG
jgi:hypothetical protein